MANIRFEELPGGAETVLVVDDDNTVRGLIRETLLTKGYAVLDAQFNSGALMVSGRHRGPIHLMIADVMMPGVNGRELARRLESLRPGTKTLYISGYPKDLLVGERILEESAAFLQKPVSPDNLLPKVREVLDGWSAASSPEAEAPDFVRDLLQALVHGDDYRLTPEQRRQLEGVRSAYEDGRLACEAELMVAELQVQSLLQGGERDVTGIEVALRQSEQAQSRARLEGLKALRAAGGLLDAEQRRRLTDRYPRWHRRLGDPLPYL